MKNYLQRIGRSLMLPVTVLPAAAILMGIGYAIDPISRGGSSPIAAFLIGAGSAIIDNMAILFAIGVALGMSNEKDGSPAFSGLVAYLIVTKLLSTVSVSQLLMIELAEVNGAFGEIENQFIGIVSGLVAAGTYNKFSEVKLPTYLSFFSGKRLVPILTSLFMLVVSGILFYIWPVIYSGLVSFGTAISSLGALGAGIYAFFNRLLIPVGLHHGLNSVFWFDLIGIDDIGNFWASTPNPKVLITGMYQAGFFPVMMFGLPAAAYAIYINAKTEKKAAIGSLMLAAGFASFLTGVTEPLEFAFMFAAPGLYLIHAILTGISVFIAAQFGWIAGFGFSAGLIDYLLSMNMPLAINMWMLIPLGLVLGFLYFLVFNFVIKVFNLKTPGREDEDFDELDEAEKKIELNDNNFSELAKTIHISLGGHENITSIDNCITRLRVEVRDNTLIDEKAIKKAGVVGVVKTGKNNVQVIIGPHVEFVIKEIKKL
jgi:PTS system N-acetylglucosamine-specific IIC component